MAYNMRMVFLETKVFTTRIVEAMSDDEFGTREHDRGTEEVNKASSGGIQT